MFCGISIETILRILRLALADVSSSFSFFCVPFTLSWHFPLVWSARPFCPLSAVTMEEDLSKRSRQRAKAFQLATMADSRGFSEFDL
jgi:hypothetical protein